jgi:opacity protein-like surface antigen
MTRTNRIVLSTAVALGLALPLVADAADSGFYVGAMAGRSSYDISIGSVPVGSIDLTPLTGGTITSITFDTVSLDKNDTGFGVTVGYQFMKYVAVEASYLDLGKAKLSATGTYTQVESGDIPFTASLEVKSSGPAVAVVGILPFGSGWDVDARVGGYFDRTEYTIAASDPSGSASGSESKTNAHLMAGVGVGYSFGENWSVRVDYMYFDKVGDKDIYQTNVNFFSGGIRFKF